MNEEELMEVAAGLFGVERSGLAWSSTPDDVDGWDSLNHLKFVTEIETRSGRRLSMTEIQSIQSLDDARRLIAA